MIALIVLTYNNVDCLRECLQSVIDVNTAPVVAIVVDNASSEANRQKLREVMSQLYGKSLVTIHGPSEPVFAGQDCKAVLVLNDENSGYARGNNVGLEVAYGMPDVDKVLVMNDDVLFVDDIIGSLSAQQDARPDCAIISPMLFKPGLAHPDVSCARREERVWDMIKYNFLKYWWQWRGRDIVGRRSRFLLADADADSLPDFMEVDMVSGAFMLIPKDVLRQVGGFDPHTYLYYEENILHKKLTAIGQRACLSTKLRAVHKGAMTTVKLPRTYAQMAANYASQRYYVVKYSGAGAFMRMLHWLSMRFLFISYALQQRLAPGHMSKKKKG